MSKSVTTITIDIEAANLLDKHKADNPSFVFSHWVEDMVKQTFGEQISEEILQLSIDTDMKKFKDLQTKINYQQDKLDSLRKQEIQKKHFEKELMVRNEEERKKLIDSTIENLELFFVLRSEEDSRQLAVEYVEKHSKKFGSEETLSLFEFGKLQSLMKKPDEDDEVIKVSSPSSLPSPPLDHNNVSKRNRPE